MNACFNRAGTYKVDLDYVEFSNCFSWLRHGHGELSGTWFMTSYQPVSEFVCVPHMQLFARWEHNETAESVYVANSVERVYRHTCVGRLDSEIGQYGKYVDNECDCELTGEQLSVLKPEFVLPGEWKRISEALSWGNWK